MTELSFFGVQFVVIISKSLYLKGLKGIQFSYSFCWPNRSYFRDFKI